MALRHYDGLAIDCDGDDCGESITDTCSISLDHLRRYARRQGWSITSDDHGCDLCPTCKDKAQDAICNGPPQVEGDGPPYR